MKKILTEKVRRSVLFICISICAFVFLETFFIPLKSRTEVVESIETRYNKSYKGKGYNSFTLLTNKKKRNVTRIVYEAVKLEDSIQVYSTMLTGSIQKIGIQKNNIKEIVKAGFLYEFAGVFFVTFPLLLSLLYFILDNTKYSFDRNSTTICALFFTLILFFEHLKN